MNSIGIVTIKELVKSVQTSPRSLANSHLGGANFSFWDSGTTAILACREIIPGTNLNRTPFSFYLACEVSCAL